MTAAARPASAELPTRSSKAFTARMIRLLSGGPGGALPSATAGVPGRAEAPGRGSLSRRFPPRCPACWPAR